jgi:hypothetical protein
VACVEIFSFKILVPAEMPRRDITLADSIALPEKKKIKNKPPRTSRRQLAEITEVPKYTIARIVQQQEKLQDEWTLRHEQQGTSQKRKREGKDPADVERVPQTVVAHCCWTRCTCQWSNIEKQVRGIS